MNTYPNGPLFLQLKSHGFRRCTSALRWIAKAWGGASALLLLAFAFGGHEHLRFTSGEATAFLLFPVGVIAGFVIAWWHELIGGIVTVGCFSLFSLLLIAWWGRWPNIYFILFAAPGFLHIAAATGAWFARVERR